MNKKLSVVAYATTVFISSAFLLVLEIVAGRIIAPYVGVSLYSWTSIIGVMLGGLSLGNYLGGVWADRGGGSRAVGLSLLLAGLSCFAVLFFLTLIAPIIVSSKLSILSASFILALCLFFLPSVLLGVIAPLLTVLALRLHPRAGHIVGMMNALAALGSIVGTFITGYWLIQAFGTYRIIIVCAIMLLLLALPYLIGPVISKARKVFALAGSGIVFLSLLVIAQNSFQSPCLYESQYYCIRVKDQTRVVPFGEARALILDNLAHGTNHKQVPEMLIELWGHLMDELIFDYYGQKSDHLRYFFAGGGSYTHARAIKARAGRAELVVAEIDPMVTKVAVEQLYLNPVGINIQHLDARVALLKHDKQSFDVIVGDVFHDITVPYHLTTREYHQLLKSRLAENGLYLLNIVDTYPDPLLVKSIYKTLKLDFKQVNIWVQKLPDVSVRTIYIISASDYYQGPSVLNAQRGFRLRSWQKKTKSIIANGTRLAQLPILSDRFAPVESLIARLLH